MSPAMKVATASPFETEIGYNIIDNHNERTGRAAYLHRKHPPAADTMKPPIMAVMRPTVGLTPLAIPKAMASGNATMPTTIPGHKVGRILKRIVTQGGNQFRPEVQRTC